MDSATRKPKRSRAARKPNRPANPPAAARYANCSTRTIYRYIKLGRLEAYRLGPKMIRVDLDDVDQLFHRVPTAGNGAA
jgi:excisionase family DNA binding protein